MKKVAIIGAGISGLCILQIYSKIKIRIIRLQSMKKDTSVSLEEGYGVQLSVNSIKLLK